MSNKGRNFLSNTSFVAKSAIIAAVYVVLTYIAMLCGLSSGVIQVRFSEALTVLPYFTSAAIPGLFVGCLLANLLTGCALWDVVLGSVATLLGAVGTYALRRFRWAAPIPPIIANTLIIPFVLAYVYHMEGTVPFFMLTVGIGEIISCGILGTLFQSAIIRYDLRF